MPLNATITTHTLGVPYTTPGFQPHFGQGAPTTAIVANIGDTYTDTLTGSVYLETGSGWVFQYSTQGPQGTQGPTGYVSGTPLGLPGTSGGGPATITDTVAQAPATVVSWIQQNALLIGLGAVGYLWYRGKIHPDRLLRKL